VGKKYRAEALGQLEIESRILGPLKENDVCIERRQTLVKCGSLDRAQVPTYELFESSVDCALGLRSTLESKC
jgi:hypothetical protein